MNVTIAIPTYNAAQTMRVCLDRLQLQRVPNLKVFVYDNGSHDGTIGMVSELAGTKYYSAKPALDKYGIDISFFSGSHNDRMSAYQNGMDTRQKIGKLVSTEYIFFLDPDVILPPNAIPEMIEHFQNTPEAGFIGIQYEPDAGHVMLGATLWRTEVFNKLGTWDGKDGCDCNFAKREVEKLGLKVSQHPKLLAYHYKHF
jgi:GT2 family glycosyltransferase